MISEFVVVLKKSFQDISSLSLCVAQLSALLFCCVSLLVCFFVSHVFGMWRLFFRVFQFLDLLLFCGSCVLWTVWTFWGWFCLLMCLRSHPLLVCEDLCFSILFFSSSLDLLGFAPFAVQKGPPNLTRTNLPLVSFDLFVDSETLIVWFWTTLGACFSHHLYYLRSIAFAISLIVTSIVCFARFFFANVGVCKLVDAWWPALAFVKLHRLCPNRVSVGDSGLPKRVRQAFCFAHLEGR